MADRHAREWLAVAVAAVVVVAGTAIAVEHFEESSAALPGVSGPATPTPGASAQSSQDSWCAPDAKPPPATSVAGGVGGTIIDWIPFIHFHGVSYGPGSFGLRGGIDDLTESDLGPLCGTVAFKVADVVTDPSYHMRDGDSAFLPIGTPIYEVRGFSPRFRLAAKSADGLMLFEAYSDPSAATAADELGDLDGRVVSIAVLDRDDRHVLVEIHDAAQVQHLVRLLLASPVDESRDVAYDDGAQVVDFTLSAGGHVIRVFFPTAGVVSNRIFVPPEFVDALEASVP